MTLLRIIAAMVALTLLFAACGDDDDGGQTATAEPSADGSPSLAPSESPSPTDGQTDGSPSPSPEPSDTDATIVLKEFAIDPERTSAKPGTITFQVHNEGELTHEFLVIRTDLPHAQLPRLDDGLGADESQLDIVGRIDEVAPGDDDEATLTLDSGNYVLICNLHTDSVSHYLSGMYDRFTVSDDAAPPDAPTE